MKKTLTVNLGGTVFQIDEDAYQLLDTYLNNLRYHFRHEEGADEIVRDMEMRISELFSESMEGGQQVITIDNVEAVIDRMGKPEELDDDAVGHTSQEEEASGAFHTEDTSRGERDACTGEATWHADGEQPKSSSAECSSDYRPKKRLFRDIDNRILGGVLSGIAAYFGWDAVIFRLVVVLLAFMGTWGFPFLLIYLILWVIIPPARTATEKLWMKGEAVNVENIGKTVTDSYNQTQHATDKVESRPPILNFFDAITRIIGLLVKVFIGILVVCCIPVLLIGLFVLFILLLATMGVCIHIPHFLYEMLPYVEWGSWSSLSIPSILFVLSGLLIAGIPLVAVLQIIFQSFGKWKPMSSGVKVGLLVLWFVSLVAGFITFFQLSLETHTSQILLM